MSGAININGIEKHLPETVDRFIQTVKRRGARYEFILYIEGEYLRIAQEHSPRFLKLQTAKNTIGTYTVDIDPEDLIGDILAEIESIRTIQ